MHASRLPCMAELTNPLSKSPSISLLIFSLKHGRQSDVSQLSCCKPSLSLTAKSNYSKLSELPKYCAFSFVPKATFNSGSRKYPRYATVQEVRSIEEFDAALLLAEDKLVLVEYIASRSRQTRPLTVELSRRHDAGVCFILVKADKSEKTRQLCRRESVEKVPHYSFHKNKERIHEKSRLKLEEFIGYVLYYGNSHKSVIQLHCKDDVEKLIDDYKADHNKLIVLNVGLRNCEPCVKVYPTMVRLSTQMKDDVVFARILGDDNDSCVEFLRNKNVVRVPTFLFIRGGEIRGRYVGSEKAKLVREVLLIS